MKCSLACFYASLNMKTKMEYQLDSYDIHLPPGSYLDAESSDLSDYIKIQFDSETCTMNTLNCEETNKRNCAFIRTSRASL